MARRTKEDAVATRNGLIDAAEQVFREKGVSRASLSDIAQAAGATRGAIYWHFKDKVDLFNAMMDRVTLPLEQGYGEFESSTCPDPVQRLRAVMALVLRGVASDERTRRVFEIALYKVEYVSELVGVRDRMWLRRRVLRSSWRVISRWGRSTRGLSCRWLRSRRRLVCMPCSMA